MSSSTPCGPVRARYEVSGLLQVGRRLTRPPAAPETPTVGSVRSLRRTPLTHITLDQLLRNQYLPPFTLREFEDYLVFKERSAENLFAVLFCRAYAAAWAQLKAGRGVQTETSLGACLDNAIALFFQPAAPHEVNVPENVRRALLIDANNCKDPSILAGVKAGAEDNLRESMNNFVSANLGNSERFRTIFGVTLGAISILFGIVLTVALCLFNLSRPWRTFALPLYWIGTLLCYASFNRTCLVIYLFGSFRQLHRWELDRPVPTYRGHNIDLALSTVDSAETKASFGREKPGLTSPSTASLGSSAWFPEPLLSGSTTSTHGLLPPAVEKLSRSAMLFSPVTPVCDPTVIREQRRRILRGALYGLLMMAILAAPTYAAPNRR